MLVWLLYPNVVLSMKIQKLYVNLFSEMQDTLPIHKDGFLMLQNTKKFSSIYNNT